MRRSLLLALALGLPALLVQLSLPVPRLTADAVEYYSHLRSLYFDRDLDFANEFEHFGILTRGDKVVKTVTGHRRTIFSVGPALLWMPFYAAGDVVARTQGDIEDGYSPWHIRAVCLGSLAYIVTGLLLLRRVLGDVVAPAAADVTILVLFYATFLCWYAVGEPVMSHAGSFFLAAAILALWWPARREMSLLRAAALGALIGLAATVRWQNAVLLLLPALSLLPALRRAPARTLGALSITLLAFALGTSPQLLAWKAIFGQYLLADPPHGRDFLRLDHPYLLQTLFSSRHGLLYWTPLLWGALLGYALFLRRDARTGLTLLAPLLVMGYVNICSGDWWAGGSFSNRRFDSLLPILSLGLAHAVASLERAAARRPTAGLVAAGALLVLWNTLLMAQYRANRLPQDETVSFARITENGAAILSESVGTPLAWPANWVFAAEHKAPVAGFDLAVGKYLFYRQNNLGGVIDAGDPRADPALFGEGWSSARPCEDVLCRAVLGSARLFAPLDVPETLTLVLRVRGEGTLRLAVNGTRVGALRLGERLGEQRITVPRERWHRELNELSFETDAPGAAWLDRIVFERPR